MTKFWMVFVEGGNAPNHKHVLESHARAEAERLARLNTVSVWVLEAKSAVKVSEVRWEDNLDDPAPF